MKTFKHLILLLFIKFSTSDEPKVKIKYELAQTTPVFTYKKTNLTQEVVTSVQNAFSITVLSDVRELKKGMLDISPETYYFWLDGRSLAVIEPGAFDNQNITEEIRLEYNNLTVIYANTFKNLKIKKLDLSYNQITHLEEGAISDLPNLSGLYLLSNRIKQIDAKSIVNTPKLWSFVVNHNNLTELGEKWFTFMKKEEAVIIGVGYNQIESINPKTFDGITVWNLGLEHNKIKEIPPEIFTKNGLLYLDLKSNELKSLPEEFFNQDNLTSVNLKENPLPCNLKDRLLKFSEGKTFEIMLDRHNC